MLHGNGQEFGAGPTKKNNKKKLHGTTTNRLIEYRCDAIRVWKPEHVAIQPRDGASTPMFLASSSVILWKTWNSPPAIMRSHFAENTAPIHSIQYESSTAGVSRLSLVRGLTYKPSRISKICSTPTVTISLSLTISR